MTIFRSALILCCCIAGLSSAAPKGPRYYDLRSMGMGNTTVATATDRTALFHNPAGLGLLKEDVELSIRPAMFSIDGAVTNYINMFSKNKDKLANISQLADSALFNDLDKVDGNWVGFDYTPEITLAKKNLGFGVYSVLPLGFRIETGHFIPKLGLRGQQDLVFTWAVGIPLVNDKNYFGISLDYLQRTPVGEYITTFSQTNSFITDIQRKPLFVLNEITHREHGANFNVGLIHNLKYGFRVAYSVNDIFGVVEGKVCIPEVNVGGAYYFPMLEKVEAIRSLIASLEFTDLIGFEDQTKKYEQFWKKIHAGAEIDLKYLALRTGLNQGYPTFGVGLMGGPLSFDYVYYTRETGYYAGQAPQSMHVLSLGLALYLRSNKIHYTTNPPDQPLPETKPAEPAPQPAPSEQQPAPAPAAPETAPAVQ
jgi:hypothetical protein